MEANRALEFLNNISYFSSCANFFSQSVDACQENDKVPDCTHHVAKNTQRRKCYTIAALQNLYFGVWREYTVVDRIMVAFKRLHFGKLCMIRCMTERIMKKRIECILTI